jgi:hypothetical protein
MQSSKQNLESFRKLKSLIKVDVPKNIINEEEHIEEQKWEKINWYS